MNGFIDWLLTPIGKLLWRRLPDDWVNEGMGGDDACHLYKHRITGTYKCVTKTRYGKWKHVTYHDSWNN